MKAFSKRVLLSIINYCCYLGYLEKTVKCFIVLRFRRVCCGTVDFQQCRTGVDRDPIGTEADHFAYIW